MSCPDCQGAQDRQWMQYLFIPRSKWKMLQDYWKFPNRNVQTCGFVYHDTNGQNHGPVWKTQSFFLSEICMVILWQDSYGKGYLRNSYCSMVGRRFPIGNAYSYTVKKGYSYLCMWDDIKVAGRKQNIDSMWKVLNKEVDLGEPTSFLDHVFLGCTQRQCEISKDIVDKYRAMFESRISAGRTEKLPYSENLRISSWSYDMEGHARKCVQRYFELSNKTTQQLALQSICSMHRWPSLQRGIIVICRRIVKSVLSDCSEMLILGTNWTTWYSMVSE